MGRFSGLLADPDEKYCRRIKALALRAFFHGRWEDSKAYYQILLDRLPRNPKDAGIVAQRQIYLRIIKNCERWISRHKALRESVLGR